MIRIHKLYFCIFLSASISTITQTAEAVTIPDISAMPSAEAGSDATANPYGQTPAAIPQIPETPGAAGSDAANPYGQTPAAIPQIPETPGAAGSDDTANPFGQTATPSNASPQNPMQPTKKKKKMGKKAKRKKGCGCKSYIPVGKKKKPYYCGY